MSEQAVMPIDMKRICFIDDSKTSAFVTKKMLRQYDYSVDHFPNAESALESLMANDYALLITDLMISDDGGVNGDDLIRIVRQSGHPSKANIPIIVVTGSSDKEILQSLITEGADSVLQKPLDAISLNEMIEKLIVSSEPSSTYEPEPLSKPVDDDVDDTQVYQSVEDPSLEDNVIEKIEANSVEVEPVSDFSSSSFREYSSDLDGKVTPSDTTDLNENQNGLGADIPTLTRVAKPTKVKRKKSGKKGKSSKRFDSRMGDEIDELFATNDLPEEENRVQETIPDRETHKEQVTPAPSVQPTTSNVDSSAPHRPYVPEVDNSLLNLLDHMEDLPQDDVDDHSHKSSSSSGGKKSKSWFSKIFLLIVVLVVVVPAVSLRLMTPKIIEVTIFKAEQGSISSQISLPGRIASKRKIKVAARESGQLVKLLVKEGDLIKKNQVLAQLDESEAKSNIKRAQARLLSIEEEVASASKTQERLQRALDVGAVSRQMVENAEATWKSASARQSVVEEELKSAELKRKRLKIRASFSGVITALFAQEGQWVSQSEKLFTLVDMSQRIVLISVDARDSASLNVGQTVILRSNSDENEWSEKIVKIGSATKSERSANIIEVTVSFGRGAPDLKVGQQVDAEIRTNTRNDTILLPYEALFNHNGAQTVALLENSKIVYRSVETGIESFTRIEIIKGLRKGQAVIIPDGIPLEAGQNAVSVGAHEFQ